MNPNRVRKSIGAERTFSDDLITKESMMERLEYIGEKVFRYMEKHDNFGRTITLKMKTPDFQIVSRSKTFNSEIKDWDGFISVVRELLNDNWTNDLAVRLLGVSASNLMRDHRGEGVQLEFDFEEDKS